MIAVISTRLPGRQLTDKEHIDALELFTKELNWSPAVVDPSAASLKAEMTFRGLPHQDADNDVLDGIRMVSSLLSQKKLRIHKPVYAPYLGVEHL